MPGILEVVGGCIIGGGRSKRRRRRELAADVRFVVKESESRSHPEDEEELEVLMGASGDSEAARLVKVALVDDGRVALVTLACAAPEETFGWGTRMCEHRLNPPLLRAVDAALDAALADARVRCVVVHGEGKFFSNGMDLQWIEENQGAADDLQRDAEALLARILAFPLPTVAAVNGHFCAAGAMLGLAFDYRVMNADKGLFFVPGIDLGLVYSPGMTALMKAKTPVHMHADMIVFGKRYAAADLERERVVLKAVPARRVLDEALQHARGLVAGDRFGSQKYRDTCAQIKQNTFKEAFDALSGAASDGFRGMGFGDGDWDDQGRARL